METLVAEGARGAPSSQAEDRAPSILHPTTSCWVGNGWEEWQGLPQMTIPAATKMHLEPQTSEASGFSPGAPQHILRLSWLPRCYLFGQQPSLPHPPAGESLLSAPQRGLAMLSDVHKAHSRRTVLQTTQDECEGVWGGRCHLGT